MNAYIYHHNDDDGFCSGAIIYELCKKKYNPEEIISYEVTYDMEFDFSEIKNDDLVFFVDYSFSNKSNIKALKELIRKITTGKVVWLDHHQTSLDLIDSALEPGGLLEGIDGVFDVTESTNVSTVSNHKFYARIDMNICGAYISYLYAIEKMGYLESYQYDSTLYIPMFIKYINSYDTWAMNMENTKEFHTGMMFKNNDISCYFEGDGFCDNGGILGNRITPLLDPTRHAVNWFIKDGIRINEYNQVQYKRMRDMLSFPCGIIVITGTDKKHYRCLAINAPNLLGSAVFGDEYNNYDIVVLFSNNGKQYQYSLYSSNKNIRCDEIAKTFGGGGHKGAAGFHSDELLFHKDCVFYVDTRDPEGKGFVSHY